MRNKILFVLICIFIYSCRTTSNNNIDIQTEPKIIQKELPKKTTEEIITEMIDSMTIEEKVGQVFIFHIRKDSNNKGILNINSETIDFIENYNPGGIILFSENIKSNDQVESLIRDLQLYSKIPLFMGVDEEGGVVSRLGKAKGVDVTHLPSALSIGNRKDTNLAYNSGLILGRELTALGFNMDMAPIADVNTNPKNPVIGNRTYSADPHIAGDMVTQVIKGFHKYNLISVIKHFPGHGDTSTDTHLGSVVSPHKKERLDQIEFVPFIKGIEAGADGIMTAHIIMPGISTSPLPATLNYDIITGIIRDEFGFDGIVITDAMDMGAITQNFSSEEAAIQSFKAGVDIILMPLDQKGAYNALLESVKSGEINEERLNQSVYRVLYTKYKRNILNKSTRQESISDVSNDPEHLELKKTILD